MEYLLALTLDRLPVRPAIVVLIPALLLYLPLTVAVPEFTAIITSPSLLAAPIALIRPVLPHLLPVALLPSILALLPIAIAIALILPSLVLPILPFALPVGFLLALTYFLVRPLLRLLPLSSLGLTLLNFPILPLPGVVPTLGIFPHPHARVPRLLLLLRRGLPLFATLRALLLAVLPALLSLLLALLASLHPASLPLSLDADPRDDDPGRTQSEAECPELFRYHPLLLLFARTPRRENGVLAIR